VLAVLALRGYVSFIPQRRKTPMTSEALVSGIVAPVYRKILVPLDHSSRDRAALAHAAAMAQQHRATLHLLHVEEGAISRLYGPMASGAEVQSGEEYFQSIVDALDKQGIPAEFTILHGQRPKNAIVQVANEQRADLIVMGAHGHRGFQDLIFGNTINGVRHEVKVPVLVVGDVPR
jgi:manganese transport protein